MDEFSEDIKKEFDKQFKNIEEINDKKNNQKMSILYVSFVVVFILVLIGTVLSFSNYLKAKNNADDNVKVVEKVVVKEY